MKILESKSSKIGIIAEFRGIPNGFPNLGDCIPPYTLPPTRLISNINPNAAFNYKFIVGYPHGLAAT
jgi:hypothetical protein